MELNKNHSPVKIGIVDAAGYMGSGIFNVVNQLKWAEVEGVYDIDTERLRKLVELYGQPRSIICSSIEELCSKPEIQVVVDGGCDPLTGAETGYFSAYNKKHLVSMNIEADVTVGLALKKLHEENGVIYTVAEGDEPSELKKFYDHYTLLNFDIIACGKGKNNPLNVQANPDSVRESLPDNGITAEQVASFIDGSKTMFEMACLSNATGLLPDIRGMHGPEAGIQEALSVFRKKENGGILEREGVVDYVTGKEISGGIFIVVYTSNKRIQADFDYLKIGKGPYYLFYQRFHNWFVDIPVSIAKVVFEKQASHVPTGAFSQVFAVAKKDLHRGEQLDGIGGFSTYGIVEKTETGAKENLFPIGLIKNAVVKTNIKKGEMPRWDMIEIPDSRIFTMYKEQYGLK